MCLSGHRSALLMNTGTLSTRYVPLCIEEVTAPQDSAISISQLHSECSAGS